MIAFRKSRRMLGRSRFWREDVRWCGANGDADLTQESRSLAYRLSGAQFDEADLYVMINAYEKGLTFHVQEGQTGDWLRVVDTSLDSPQDIVEPGEEQPLASLDYEVGPRSVVVLARRRQGTKGKKQDADTSAKSNLKKTPRLEKTR
jgi:glycogen operon protein